MSEERIIGYLKWKDSIIGRVFADHAVEFLSPDYNPVVRQYTKEQKNWSPRDFLDFVEDRIVPRERQDIAAVLSSYGLVSYDPFSLALATGLSTRRDFIWLATDEKEDYRCFVRRKERCGVVDYPEGCNIKTYAHLHGKDGIQKKRLSSYSKDIEAELASKALADLWGVPCCPVEKVDEDTVFSEFLYDFSKEYLVHFRYVLRRHTDDLLEDMISARPKYLRSFIRLMAFDFLTRQDDRHMSNLAVLMDGEGETLYPLYDNGRSLFYEDGKETMEKAVKDIRLFSTSFGPCGTYYDQVMKMKDLGVEYQRILNLNFTEDDIRGILQECGFQGHRLEYTTEWIMNVRALLLA